jgi:hypothetical protein
MKPSESYAGSEDTFYEFMFQTLDALHNRIEALELNAKVQSDPDKFRSSPTEKKEKLVSMEDVIRKIDRTLCKDAPLSHEIKAALLELL